MILEKKYSSNVLWGVLQSIPGLGGSTIRKLIDFYGSVEYCWEGLVNKKLPPSERGILTTKLVTEIKQLDINTMTKELAKNLLKYKVSVLAYTDNLFPRVLTEIYNPPAVLFYKGNINCLEMLDKSISMVGARNCSAYGKNVAQYFSRELASYGVVIVSGGARGIDTNAHKGCLESGGTTIVVMGCGLDKVYPPENRQLYKDVISHEGLLLSEYSIGVDPIASNFPARNRIIAGLTRGVIVVEAKAKSGSLITADMAVNEGREVFTIPGNILNTLNDGSHWLIRQGAGVLTRPEDLLDAYYWEHKKIIPQKEVRQKSNSMIVFTKEERKVLSVLSTENSLSLEEIVLTSKLALPIVQNILLNFELQNVIQKSVNQGYILLYSGRE